jgi:leader peptidase (prepilin peptidase)/N-methyltransferase
MLVTLWITFLLVMLFLLGSAVGSFLNVCIVRLPQARSLLRPASCCGHCHEPIRARDNLPLLSYWLLRGRCRACGTPFSMRYFWIELLTGVLFALIYHLEIGWNVHHFTLWNGRGYWFLHAGVFPPRSWPIFIVRAVMTCFLIVAVMCNVECHKVPGSVTRLGILTGLLVGLLCPWPWPDGSLSGSLFWQGDLTRHAGLYPWPVWYPLPDWLPPGQWQLGATTVVAGILAGAILTGLVRLLFNAGVGARAIGWGETSLLTIAGSFLGWQPVVVAFLLALAPGMIAALLQWTAGRRQQVSYSLWLALALVVVWLGWNWIAPFARGVFFEETCLLWIAAICGGSLLAFAVCLRMARPVAAPSART